MALLARRCNPRGLEARADSGSAGDGGQLPSRGRVAGRIALYSVPDAEPVRVGRRSHVQNVPQANRSPRIAQGGTLIVAKPLRGFRASWAGVTPCPFSIGPLSSLPPGV